MKARIRKCMEWNKKFKKYHHENESFHYVGRQVPVLRGKRKCALCIFQSDTSDARKFLPVFWNNLQLLTFIIMVDSCFASRI